MGGGGGDLLPHLTEHGTMPPFTPVVLFALSNALGRNEGPTAGITEGVRNSEGRRSIRKTDDLLTVEEGR